MGVTFVELNGATYSVIQCAACDHRTPAGGTCLMCQPLPDVRCLACFLRGPVPTTTTIAPGLMNDDPMTQIIVNPGGHIPNDELLKIAKKNPPPVTWHQDDANDPTT